MCKYYDIVNCVTQFFWDRSKYSKPGFGAKDRFLLQQNNEMFRETHHIYGLLSTDKREKDSSERCLLKISFIVIPASLELSKVPNTFFNIKR
jgi:hypothetical protein